MLFFLCNYKSSARIPLSSEEEVRKFSIRSGLANSPQAPIKHAMRKLCLGCRSGGNTFLSKGVAPAQPWDLLHSSAGSVL